MIAAIAGLVAGIIHVWSGPDHLAAIAPLAARRHRRVGPDRRLNFDPAATGKRNLTAALKLPGPGTMTAGARWGMGHSAGVAVIGMLLLWLRGLLPLQALSSWGERLVGVMLVGIGAWAFRKAFHVHAHEHEHDGDRHVHLHAHGRKVSHESTESHQHHTHAAFGIGLLHGLAGSSHLFGVLPILAFPDRAQALTYLATFAVGTIISMAAFSYVVGWLACWCQSGTAKAYRALMTACAVSAIAVGCFWLVHPMPGPG